jgi:hypothetical protein
MALNFLLDQVRGAISNHADQPQNNFDSGGLINTIEGLFGQHAQNTGQVLSSSQDPYGDPADQQGQVRSSSQDPYGDPADQR